MLNSEIIDLMKKSIKPKKTDEWVNLDINCFLYAMNCDVPTEKVLYIDKDLKCHCAWDVGEVSNNSKKDINKEELVFAFLEDCKLLEISAKKVDEDYELTMEDEWLVALFLTDSFYYFNSKRTDFHFLKKNFNDKTWSHKFPYGDIKFVDDNNKQIILPSDFVCYADVPNALVNYEYIATYRLIRKKDLVKEN